MKNLEKVTVKSCEWPAQAVDAKTTITCDQSLVLFFAATIKRTPDYRLRQQKDNKNSSDSLDVVLNLSLTTQSGQNDKTYFILSTVPGDIRKAVAERYVIYSNISLPV